ncbi:unnamed protein product [Adineta steineri]|uniref:Uncharacterized protein n=2 Tax=Adineta steineri TaxID=433720 RepID=A0A815CLE0_9BILA|nr:unnamed protein product [Adineta steineri]CAF1288841.1 unnamed protein product [Adineta steineri]CAF3739717.1 unnamed protein product [Adineta steineri]
MSPVKSWVIKQIVKWAGKQVVGMALGIPVTLFQPTPIGGEPKLCNGCNRKVYPDEDVVVTAVVDTGKQCVSMNLCSSCFREVKTC